MIKKQYLLSPGPTPIPESSLSSAVLPLIHHRTAEFSNMYASIIEGLQYVFQTQEDVYILTSSGSGAMQAAVVNILSAGEKVLTINCGKFGERWGKICRVFGLDVHEINLEWGAGYSKHELEAELSRDPNIQAVFSTLSETSTGTVYDIKGYAEVTSQHGALFVVDGISGIGATPCPMDDWNIDVLISGSQKAFMTPPGLAYIAFSRKAWKKVETSTLPRFYFDAREYRKSHAKKTTPWTPATSLLMQQKNALDIIRRIGLKNLFRHHHFLGEACRAGIKALELELFSSCPGDILTAVTVPKECDGKKLLSIMQDKYGIIVAGGQSQYQGLLFRIAHLGYTSAFDIITALSALEMTLRDLGYPFEPGSSVKAAEIILKEYYI